MLARYNVPCLNFAWRAAFGMQPMPPVNSGGRYAQKTADIARGMPRTSGNYSSLGQAKQNCTKLFVVITVTYITITIIYITSLNASSRQALLHIRRATVLHYLGTSRSKPAGVPGCSITQY